MAECSIKHCSCGQAFSREQWDGLEHLPDWPLDSGRVAQVRNCTCGSTLLLEGPAVSAAVAGRLHSRANEPTDVSGRRFRKIVSRVACGHSGLAEAQLARASRTSRAG